MDTITIQMQPKNIYGELVTENGIEVSTVPKISVGTDTVTIPLQEIGYGSVIVTITLCPFPLPEIVVSPTGGCAPLTVQCSATNSEFLDSQLWDFGNGQTSGDETPSVEYTAGGDYIIGLTGYNLAGSAEADSKTVEVLEPPIADFYANATSGNAPLSVGFVADCDGDVSSYLWNFGDGYTAGVQNPTHTYTQGTFSPSLTAGNKYCSDNITKSNYIVSLQSGQWVSIFDNTKWGLYYGAGSWTGSSWAPALVEDWIQLSLVPLGSWSSNYRPTEIRIAGTEITNFGLYDTQFTALASGSNAGSYALNWNVYNIGFIGFNFSSLSGRLTNIEFWEE